ncbi:MAG: type II toxin-antitoxin system VapC family toxin [Nitrospirota bacterium]|nr:type II toxin-antitoxin system VapC family toxin [Nitrospirota bacterium]
MITAIDTNILLDILIPDEDHASTSKALLDLYNEKGSLVISEMVFAELASQFSSEGETGDFLSDTSIRLVHSNEKALSIAGVRWKEYRKSRKDKLQCPVCGKKTTVHCPGCNKNISFRQHIISDFIIGAHALVQAELLLTRDRGFYKTYFRDLKIVQEPG